jgi:hypothetical protein
MGRRLNPGELFLQAAMFVIAQMEVLMAGKLVKAR